MTHTDLDQHYWDTRYLNEAIAWDLGAISPPLRAYVDQLNEPGLDILIPGGGNSYEAAYLLDRGYTSVTVLDISGVVIEQLRQRFLQAEADGRLKLIHRDFFEHQGAYDLIIEQTFFCALAPALRPRYARQMRHLLRPGGRLTGLLFDRSFVGGPPFGGTCEEYRRLFEQENLIVQRLEPCYNSVAPRAGSEVFFSATKEPQPRTDGTSR